MNSLLQRLRRRARPDEGASAVEYGLLVALIAVVIAIGVAALGSAVSGAVENACDKIGAGAQACDGSTTDPNGDATN